MQKVSTMHDRLRQSRRNAGYRTAIAAIKECGWMGSAYRAHENGQNSFNGGTAILYARAYNVSASWLLFGVDNTISPSKHRDEIHVGEYNCAELIFAAATLLKDNQGNLDLIEKIENCCFSLRAKI